MPDCADVVVIGAGAAGMAAAALCAAEGFAVTLIEKTAAVGGTTATSGGMVWAPTDIAAARTYLDRVIVGEDAGGRRESFLTHAGAAIAALEAGTALRFQPVARYPDYYPDLPGATLGGRVLEPVPFDGRALGRHFALLRAPLREFTPFGGMMIGRADLAHFRRATRSPGSALVVARRLAAHASQRLAHPRGTRLVLGNALAGRLLLSVLRRGVDLRFETAASRLVFAEGRVQGVIAGGKTLHARRGVVLASGGFSHDPALREALLPAPARRFSAAFAGDSGDGIRLAREIGAAFAGRGADAAFWTPVSSFTRDDGSVAIFPHTVTDRGKPGSLVVDERGRRFVNEALSYHEFVRAMLAAGLARAFLICDHGFLRRYGLGPIAPIFPRPRRWVRRGYLTAAPSIGGLAQALGLDPAALTATIAGFNEDAARGEDREFGRGSDAYQRHLGDPDRHPNPCLAPLTTPPFYAITLYPADLGTSAGLATDAGARVLDDAGAPIAGLYACGNDMSSIMDGAYPGPGITLGPALTFAYLATRALAGREIQ
jgi:succinate dehydrogenase/fumarate reductase flavoprotein subunit